jgi:hypothetical protein
VATITTNEEPLVSEPLAVALGWAVVQNPWPTQVLPSLLLFVKSGHVVLLQVTLVRVRVVLTDVIALTNPQTRSRSGRRGHQWRPGLGREKSTVNQTLSQCAVNDSFN